MMVQSFRMALDKKAQHHNKISMFSRKKRWLLGTGSTRMVPLRDRFTDPSQLYLSKIWWISTGTTRRKSTWLKKFNKKLLAEPKITELNYQLNRECIRAAFQGRTKLDSLTWKSKAFSISRKWVCKKQRSTQMEMDAKSSLLSKKLQRQFHSFITNLTLDPLFKCRRRWRTRWAAPPCNKAHQSCLSLEMPVVWTVAIRGTRARTKTLNCSFRMRSVSRKFNQRKSVN